jgi:transposase
MLLADRGYDADWIRAFVTKKGAWADVPPRCNRTEPICSSPHLYRARNLVERFFDKIKQCRRVATRYDKLAADYLAFIQLAFNKVWLRVYEFTALAHGRAKLCDQALRKLMNLRTFDIAQKGQTKTLMRWRGRAIAIPSNYRCFKIEASAYRSPRGHSGYPTDAASCRGRSADRGVEPAGWREAGC